MKRTSASPDRKFDRPERNHSCSSELSRDHTPTMPAADAASKRRKLDDKVLSLHPAANVVVHYETKVYITRWSLDGCVCKSVVFVFVFLSPYRASDLFSRLFGAI